MESPVRRKFHAGFGKKGARFLSEETRAWQRVPYFSSSSSNTIGESKASDDRKVRIRSDTFGNVQIIGLHLLYMKIDFRAFETEAY